MSENCVFIFYIIPSLAFASGDRAAAVVALCECQASRALREVYLLVSKAARCRDSGNCESVNLQGKLCSVWRGSRSCSVSGFPVHSLHVAGLFLPPLCRSPLTLLLLLFPLSQCSGSLFVSFRIV